MITGIITIVIICAVIGSILYGQRLIKTEKSDAVFGNPERAKGGIHWVVVGTCFLLFTWLYYSWDIAKAFYPKSANERSEEHTSELQSRTNLVCRLLLEKKKKT